MAAIADYAVRALLLRSSRSSQGKDAQIHIWQPSSDTYKDFEETLPLLPERPLWVHASETLSFGGSTLHLRRLSLPHMVHFRKAARLHVTSIVAATLENTEASNGSWIPADKVVKQADKQWRSILTGMCSQYAHAITSGYPCDMNADQLHRSSDGSTELRPHDLSTSTSAPISKPSHMASMAVSAGNRGDDVVSIGPGCSGYIEETHAWGLEDREAGSSHSNEEAEPSDSEEQGASNERAPAREPVQWQSGQIANIEEGGRDVQSVLDAEGVQLAIIHWHAPWIEACLEILPYLKRLSAKFQSLAIMNLDVEVSMANKLLAYEKVLTRSESRRRGAKPVVRNNHTFPCLTVHNPSDLNPMQTFCGKNALDDLAVGALVSRSKELTAAPEVKEQDCQGLAEPKPKSDDRSAQPQPPSEHSEKQATTTQYNSEKKAGGEARPDNFTAIKRGAIELRQQLYEAKQAGQRVAILWISGNPQSQDVFLSFAAAHPADVFLQADVTLGKDNRLLASSLKVKSFPTIQVYTNLKLIKHIDSKTAVKDIHQTLLDAFAALGAKSTAAKESAYEKSRNDIDLDSTEDRIKALPQGEGGGVGGKKGSEAEPQAGYNFAPPEKVLQSEQKRKFSKGTGIYYPKMPCLRCGCPWWLGEGWDARCARCQWTAEKEGYDDESQPLPKYKIKYKLFTESIKAGKTPEWPPQEA